MGVFSGGYTGWGCTLAGGGRRCIRTSGDGVGVGELGVQWGYMEEGYTASWCTLAGGEAFFPFRAGYFSQVPASYILIEHIGLQL